MARTNIKKKYAIFAGRWQPFHNGHLWVTQQILKSYEFLILGIVNPTPEKPSDPEFHRFKREENPFTYWERLEMLSNLFEVLKQRDRVVLVPMWHPRVSITKEECFLPPRRNREWIVPIAECEEYKKAEEFSNLGETVRIIHDIPQKILSFHAVSIRLFIVKGDEKLEKFLPQPILDKIISFNGIERIKDFHSVDSIKKFPTL